MAPIDRTFRCHQSAMMTSPIVGACGPRISFPRGHRPEGRRISPRTDPPLHNKKAPPGPSRAGCRVEPLGELKGSLGAAQPHNG